jgi:hypothetical protein
MKLCIGPCPILVASIAATSKYTDNTYGIFSKQEGGKGEKKKTLPAGVILNIVYD